MDEPEVGTPRLPTIKRPDRSQSHRQSTVPPRVTLASDLAALRVDLERQFRGRRKAEDGKEFVEGVECTGNLSNCEVSNRSTIASLCGRIFKRLQRIILRVHVCTVRTPWQGRHRVKGTVQHTFPMCSVLTKADKPFYFRGKPACGELEGTKRTSSPSTSFSAAPFADGVIDLREPSCRLGLRGRSLDRGDTC